MHTWQFQHVQYGSVFISAFVLIDIRIYSQIQARSRGGIQPDAATRHLRYLRR